MESKWAMVSYLYWQRIIDYVKMDIENSEWGALETMFQEGVLKNIKQIAMELHIPVEFDRAEWDHWGSVHTIPNAPEISAADGIDS